MSALLEMSRPAGSSFKDNRAAFTVDVPFTKTLPDDEKARQAGDLILRGYASTWVEDRDGEYVDPGAFDKSLPLYLEKNPIILWQHQQGYPFGQMKEAFVDANGLNVVAVIHKPDPKEPAELHMGYNKVKAGVVRTFSIGGFFEREFVMGRSVIKTVELMEVSVVSIPSNPDSIFEAAAKAMTSAPTRPQLLQGHIKQMKQLLGVEPMTDPELVVMTPDERVARHAAIAEAYVKAGKTAPELGEWKALESQLSTLGTRDQAVELTPKLIALVKKINGGVVDEKGGRILSRSNERKLRDVRGLLEGMEKQVDELAEQAKTAIAETRTELDVVLKQVEDSDDEPAPAPADPDPADGDGGDGAGDGAADDAA